MPNDQFGREVAVGDTVIVRGQVTKVLEDPGYINCTVQVQQPMPPAGTIVNLQLNTQQVEKQA